MYKKLISNVLNKKNILYNKKRPIGIKFMFFGWTAIS